MATLTIRNLPDDLHAALRIRAARAGRSMEEEARRVLKEALSSAANDASAAAEELRALIREANGGQLPRGAVERLIADRRAEAAQDEAEHAERMALRAERGAP